ncbi:energy transducer TonB [Flavivirga aquimarina]|uniref:Energy transducer TonB n=1 Tax=Flavivirga aquimarina TaxID=2027862 RepID=A0ABT8WFM4_9FLAO|nr:energy transducer TonB [Flavivirga aquimarina]MDO5971950.1 energy transducer TonB [Flavivirga aquimarina]
MKNNIQNIELINKYLNKRLSEKEVQGFEDLLKTDTDFKGLYEEHIVFLEGLKRQSLKGEIKKAKQSYVRNKWFKYFGFTSIVIALCTVIFFNVFNSDKETLKSKLNFELEYVQNFQVAIDSIVEVIGEKGTIVRFNPKDLETSPNKPFIADSLNIELIELINKQDLLLANAQTCSNNKWLVSGGAFKIDIKANGESLVLKEGKTIDVRFPRHTTEGDMQIFYGARDEENNMNWEASEVELEAFPFVIFIGNSIVSFIDEELTRLYGVDMYKKMYLIDSLGRIDIEKNFPKVNYYDKSEDTIRVYKEKVLLEEERVSSDEEYYRIIEVDSLAWLKNKREITIDSVLINLEDFRYSKRYNIASASVYEQVSKLELSKMKDAISKENYNKLKKEQYYLKEENKKIYETLDKIYQTIQLSKLGWINIDRFASEEQKITVKLNFNVKTNHNELYVVDKKNNTVLNVYGNEIDLPVNRSFYIVAIGIKGKHIYGFKKSVRFSENGTLKVDFKKINESQIRSILTLNSSINTPDPLSNNDKPKSNKSIVLDSISNQNDKQLKEEEEVYNQVAAKSKEGEVFKYSKVSQVFRVDTKKDTTINCKERTKLIIKANSFTDSKGNLIKGNIDLNVTEYYKLSDMLLANLSTTSNGKQLETGGMLFIEAKKGEVDLKLRENSSIEISFLTANKKEGMQLFSGEWKNGAINWSIEEDLKEESIIDDEGIIEVEENTQVPFSIVEQVPIYPGCETLDKVTAKECTTDAINKFVQRNFNTEMAKNLGLTGRQRINTIFRINQNGNVVNIRSRASDPDLEDEANRVIALLPKMIPGKQRGKAVTVPYSLPIIFRVEGDGEFIAKIGSDLRVRKRIRDSINNIRFKNRLKGKESTKVTASEVNRYILRTSNLGWINCDRFIRNKQKIKYKIKINNNGGAKVSMIFKSINSVLPGFRRGNVFDFEMVPKNEDIILVVTKKDNGKLYLDIIETTTEENPNIEFNFKEATIAELKEQLKKLDKLFN